MEKNKKVNFIRINHKNKIEYFSEDKLVEFKMSLFTKLSNMQELDLSENINNFMEKLITNYRDDPMELNYKMAKNFYENNPNCKFDRKCPEILLILDKILNHNFNMEFKCNEVFVNFLSRILFFCFKDMKVNSKNYSIKNYADFKNKINDIIYEDVNFQDYVVISKDESKQTYKKSRNSGKIVQSFKTLDNIEINLNNQINNDINDNKNDNYENNRGNVIMDKNKQNFKDIEITTNIIKTNLNLKEKAYKSSESKINLIEIGNKSLSDSNMIQIINGNLSSMSYPNNDSRKSSFKSNGDFNNSITKKSTFSSSNCKNNAIADILVQPNIKFNKDGFSKGEEKKEIYNNCLYIESQPSIQDLKFEKGDLNDLSIEHQKNKNILNIENKEKININKISDLNNYSTESFLTPVKPKSNSCQLLKLKNTENELEKSISSSKEHAKSVFDNSKLLEQKNKDYLSKTETKSTNKSNNAKCTNKSNITEKDIKSKKYLNTNEVKRKSNTTNNSINKVSLNLSHASEFFKLNFSHIVNSKKNIYVEYKKEREFHRFGIPIYLILLVQKLMTIKKITITIPKNLKNNGGTNNTNNNNWNNLIDNYAILLLNLDWLFQNLLEIEIDFGVGKKKFFDKHFKVKLNKEGNDIAYGKKFRNSVEEYKQSFELLFLISVFSAKLSNLYIFTLNNYSCYFFEMDYISRMYHKELRFVHILDIFNNYINLIRLNVNFNALDSFTFERIINLIQMNNNLKCINFDFRIDGEDFSVESLKRIYLKHYLYFNSKNNQAGCLIDKPDFSDNNFQIENGTLDNNTDNSISQSSKNNNNNNHTYGGYLNSIYQNGFGFFKKNSTESDDIVKTKDYQSNPNINNSNFNSFIGNKNNNSNCKTSILENHTNYNTALYNFNCNSDEITVNPDCNVASYYTNTSQNGIQSVLSLIEEENENKFVNLIMKKFEPLLESLFFIIESKKNLMELNFNLNLPNIISSNDNFIMTLQKFLFNIFKSLDNPDCNLKTIKIKSPYLCFNNRKYPVIEKFINTVDLQKNNTSINNFTLDIQINKIPNIVNLIPKNVQFLYLGEFDIDTFIYFKKNFLEKNLFLNSQINSLTISFNGSILDKALLINEFKYIYDSEKPSNLKEIQILSNLIVDKISLKEILLSIKSDIIEKYYFEFNKQSLENFNYFRSNLQKINLKKDKDKLNELKLNYFFNVLSRYREDININMSRKIVYNIIRFVTPICVTNIEIKFRE